MDEPMREQAAVLALIRAAPGEWYQAADVIAGAGSALRLLGGEPVIMSAKRLRQASELVSRVDHADVARARALIERVSAQGVRLITILDDDYPQHLRLIFNRPPFIWVRGRLESRNLRAIAMVGTRQASQEGRAAAARLARGLATAGVTVLSGLARGIDTAAHAATLEAGGTTVAVIGTGILARVYPPENGELARRIVGSGGALRMQARLALEHGKRLFLPQALVENEAWASTYAARPGVTVVGDPNDILDELVKVSQIPYQPSLSF